MTRYYYSPTATSNCISMDFGGCLGNGNNFATPDACSRACSTTTGAYWWMNFLFSFFCSPLLYFKTWTNADTKYKKYSFFKCYTFFKNISRESCRSRDSKRHVQESKSFWETLQNKSFHSPSLMLLTFWFASASTGLLENLNLSNLKKSFALLRF